jgi:hypothetical protein
MAFKVQVGPAQIAIHQAQTVLMTASAFFPLVASNQKVEALAVHLLPVVSS